NLNLEATYGLNDAVLYMSVGILIYLFTFYWLIAKASLALASFVGSLMLVLPFMNVFNETNQSTSSIVFIVTWLITSLAVGMHGFVISLGAMLVSFIYILLEIEFDFGNLKPMGLVLIVGAMSMGLVSYFFWRHKFITESSERIDQLSGQLVGKEQQTNILIQSISDGIIVVDTNSKVTFINSAAAKMAEWPEQEMIGFDARKIMRLILDEKSSEIIPNEQHPFSQVLALKKRFSKTLVLLNRKDERKYISLIISPVILPKEKDSKIIGAIAVFRDVSSEKSEEQRRGEFISTASHEMRTPVAAIEGYLALALNDKVSKIDPKAREFLDKAHASTQHLGKLFQDLLTSAKAEDGRLTSHPTAIEMGEFVKQLSDDLRFGAEKKGLDVEFIISNNEQGEDEVIDTVNPVGSQKTIQPFYYSYADPDRVREVITNVFDNAVKYTSEGGIKLGITGNEQVIQIRISDTGPGISKEDLPHLFQKFYRVDNSATRSIGGTGLGLFICKKIIELYKGNIWAESELGKGTAFYINLPRLTSSQAQDLQKKAEASAPA
ncbi:MAG: ATP-binding protein, partial [Candidatus Saccharimonadales bacterium]